VNVRRAAPGDETILRRLRLEALADAPDDFDSTLERERARTDDDWRRWITDGATFLFEHEDEPCGIAAGIRHRDDPHIAFLVSMWVHPEFRGTGAADALIRPVQAWAAAEGIPDLWLHVDARNTRARRAYERNSFRLTGEMIVRARDGMPELEMRYAVHPRGR